MSELTSLALPHVAQLPPAINEWNAEVAIRTLAIAVRDPQDRDQPLDTLGMAFSQALVRRGLDSAAFTYADAILTLDRSPSLPKRSNLSWNGFPCCTGQSSCYEISKAFPPRKSRRSSDVERPR